MLFVGCQSSEPLSLFEWKQANQYAKDGLWREARSGYLRVLKTGQRPPGIFLQLGLVALKLGEYQRAEGYLRRSERRDAGQFLTQFYLAEAYRGQSRFADAIFHYKTALEKRPKDQEVLKALAWSYFRIHYYTEALQVARRLRKYHPAEGQGVIIEARTLLKMKRLPEAFKLVSQQLNRASDHLKPYYQSVAGDITYSMGKLHRAYNFYKKAIRREPLLAGALLGVGRCLAAKGKFKRAVVYMERAVRARPALTEGYLALAKIYEKLHSRKALRYYRKFRKSVDKNPEYLSMVPQLDDKIRHLSQAKRI